jgi:hypothetical protein
MSMRGSGLPRKRSWIDIVRKTIRIVIAFSVGVLLVAQVAQAQGTLYVSNIVRLRSGGDALIASNSWIAELIDTGNDSSGYILDSIQLDQGTPNPGGINVSIYTDVNNVLSSDLGNLGSPSTSSPGIYTYGASGLALAASTEYFVVATVTPPAGTSSSWEAGTGSSASGSDQWMIGGLNLQSTDQGSDWTPFLNGTDLQMAIYATAVPEPSTWALCLLGGGFAFYVLARKRPVPQAKLD